MTKQELNHILDRLDYWRSIDKKMQKAMDDFVTATSEGSYAPIYTTTRHEAYLDAISVTYPWLREDLEYYLYDISISKGLSGKIKDKVYNFDNRDEYVDFVLTYAQTEANKT